MNELVLEIYNELKNIILKDFDINEQVDIKQGYIEYLNNNYSSFMDSSMPKDKIINIFIKSEILTWSNKSKEDKERLLIKDEFLNKISDLSNIGFECALSKLNNKKLEITLEESENNIKLMKDYSKDVKTFNKEVAEQYISEGILDYKYAFSDTDNMSFRLNSYKG